MRSGDERRPLNYEVDQPHKAASRGEQVAGLLQQKLLELGLLHKSAEAALSRPAGPQRPPKDVASGPQHWELKRASDSSLSRLAYDLRTTFPHTDFVLHRIMRSKADLSEDWNESMQQSICRLVAGIIQALLLDGDVIGADTIIQLITVLLGSDVVIAGKRRPLLIKKHLDSIGFDHITLWQNIKEVVRGINGTILSLSEAKSPASATDIITLLSIILKALKIPSLVLSWKSTSTDNRLERLGDYQISPRLLVIADDGFQGEIFLGLLPLKLRLVVNTQENIPKPEIVSTGLPKPQNLADFTFHENETPVEDVDEFLKEYQGEAVLSILPIAPFHSFRFVLKSEYFVYSAKVERMGTNSHQKLRSWRLLQFDVIRSLNRFLDRFSEATQNVEIQADLAQSRRILQAKGGYASDRGVPGSTTIIQNPVYIQHSVVQGGSALFALGNYPTAPY